MDTRIAKEIQLRLKAPITALERVAQGQPLPKIFAEAALDELLKLQELAIKMENDMNK